MIVVLKSLAMLTVAFGAFSVFFSVSLPIAEAAAVHVEAQTASLALWVGTVSIVGLGIPAAIVVAALDRFW